MDNFGLPSDQRVDKQVFTGNSLTSGASWHTWVRPKGKTMAKILVIGGGGGGGSGAIGANSAAAGGGGGGSASQVAITVPLDLLPPRLYISVAQAKTGAGVASYVSAQPSTVANHVVAMGNGGGAGGNAAGATPGAAGAAGSVPTAALMPLGYQFVHTGITGQAGIIGGVAVAGAALTHPLTGLRVTGGTGGGGLPAAAAAGTSGGAITAIASPSFFRGLIGGAGSATATAPAAAGQNGSIVPEAGLYYYGGTGGASTHGTATGGGLVQAKGGDGGIGSGGGGMGGALTGSAAAALSLGGPGLVIIWCF